MEFSCRRFWMLISMFFLQGPDKKDPTWWKDALAKAKNIATSLSKEGPNDSTSEYLKVLNQSSQGKLQ